MNKFEKGSDIPFDFNLEIEGTDPIEYLDIESLETFEIWLYTAKNDIKKYRRVAEEGYNELVKTDNYNYTAILTDTMTEAMKCGDIMLKIIYSQANDNYPDGFYNFEQTINTETCLINMP
jgi:hypothetical protein